MKGGRVGGSASWSRLAGPEGGPWRCFPSWHVEGVLSSDGQPRGSQWRGTEKRRGPRGRHWSYCRRRLCGGAGCANCRSCWVGSGAAAWGHRAENRLYRGGWRPPPSARPASCAGRGEGRAAREAGAERLSHSAPLGLEQDFACRLGSHFISSLSDSPTNSGPPSGGWTNRLSVWVSFSSLDASWLGDSAGGGSPSLSVCLCFLPLVLSIGDRKLDF